MSVSHRPGGPSEFEETQRYKNGSIEFAQYWRQITDCFVRRGYGIRCEQAGQIWAGHSQHARTRTPLRWRIRDSLEARHGNENRGMGTSRAGRRPGQCLILRGAAMFLRMACLEYGIRIGTRKTGDSRTEIGDISIYFAIANSGDLPRITPCLDGVTAMPSSRLIW
jgi:hypothetical protein